MIELLEKTIKIARRAKMVLKEIHDALWPFTLIVHMHSAVHFFLALNDFIRSLNNFVLGVIQWCFRQW